MSKPEQGIGELLVKEGYLTPEELERVVAIQLEQKQIIQDKQSLGAGSSYRPLGQICVEQNLISGQELQRLLRKYHKRILLGELLVNQELLKPGQLQAALKLQQQNGQKLGMVLVTAGLITESQLLDALSLQLDAPRVMPSLELLDSTLVDHFPIAYYQQHLCLPMYQSGRELTVVMADPQNEALLAELEKVFRLSISPALATEADILETLREYDRYSSLPGLQPLTSISVLLSATDRMEEPKAPTLEKPLTPPPEPKPVLMAEDASVGGSSVFASSTQRRQEEQVVSFLIKNALKDRATDIHIEPQEKHIRIRYRVDGVLHHKTDLPTHLGPPLVQRLKELCHLELDTSDHQRNRVEGHVNGQDLELDIATYPSIWGETMVLSLQEKQGSAGEVLLGLERIGFSPLNQRRYQHLLGQPGGLIILTGPARAGKTTTLYASINYLNQQNRSILTAEHPIERQVAGTVQGAYRPESGSYAQMIRSMMHLDPDILMVSEICDAETLDAVAEVALTGAKVLTAYPAFDATGALLRLRGMGLENYLIASSHIAVLSQRLVRRLCSHCRQPHTPEQDVFNRLGLVDVKPESFSFYRPVGCELCSQHGYKGQLAIHELLQLNEAIREAVLNHKPASTIRGIARTEAKLVSMAEDGLYKAIEGLTSIEEVQRVAFVNEYDSQTPWEAEEIYSICKGLEAEFY
jgi:type IV pilus assembly protein PilB